MTVMTPDDPSSIQTHPSLINRLKHGDDTASWQEFYRVYGKLVRDFAMQAGLTGTEAEEVVQETAISMARHLPEYQYNPKVCRFKTWLLNQASWRIKDQFRKRKAPGCEPLPSPSSAPATSTDSASRTATAYRVPDPASVNFDELFETEWRKNLFTLALGRVKEKFSLEQFQVFDLLVNKEWPAANVAKALCLSPANVYVIRHRIGAALKKETRQLEKQLELEAQMRLAGPHGGA